MRVDAARLARRALILVVVSGDAAGGETRPAS
jgi:hypothetical protein